MVVPSRSMATDSLMSLKWLWWNVGLNFSKVAIKPRPYATPHQSHTPIMELIAAQLKNYVLTCRLVMHLCITAVLETRESRALGLALLSELNIVGTGFSGQMVI